MNGSFFDPDWPAAATKAHRNWKCPECWVLGGRHASHCQSKGYQSVGPHPDAPPPSESSVRVAPSLLPQCPCGIARLDCDYHRTPSPSRGGDGEVSIEPYDALRRAVEECFEAFGIDVRTINDAKVQAAVQPPTIAECPGHTFERAYGHLCCTRCFFLKEERP